MFSAPVRVVELGAPGVDDWGPALRLDGREIFFYSQRAGGVGAHDIYTATRPSPTSLWSAPTLVSTVSSPVTERSPWLSRDGLTLGFASDRAAGVGGLDLYSSTRASLASPFDPPQLIPNVNSNVDELNANPSADGLRLYISSGRPGGPGSTDFFVASRTTLSDAFGTPVLIPELSTASFDRDVMVSADELEAFIVAIRTGSMAEDIFRATRPDVTSPFSIPVRVDELSTATDDVGPSLSNDGTELYFNYNAVSSGGDSEIWVATRTCLSR